MNAVKSKLKVVQALAAMAIPAVISFVVVMGVVFTSEAKRVEDLVQSYTESIAHGISAFFAEARAIASAAATLTSVQDLDWSKAGLDLADFVRVASYVQRITMSDTEGYVYDAYATGPAGNRWQGGRRTWNDNDPNAAPVNISDRPYFRVHVGNNPNGEFFAITSEVYFPYVIGGKVFANTASIIKDGKAIGVVNVAQTAIELSRLYEDISIDFLERFGKEGHIYLVSFDGELVSNLSYNEKYGAYMDELFGSDETVPVSVLGDDAVAAITEAAETDKRVVSFNVHGQQHYIAGIRIPSTPFAVCLAVSRRQMRQASRIIAAIARLTFFLTALVGSLVFFIVLRDVSNGGGGKPRSPKRAGKYKRPKGFDEHLAPPELPIGDKR